MKGFIFVVLIVNFATSQAVVDEELELQVKEAIRALIVNEVYKIIGHMHSEELPQSQPQPKLLTQPQIQNQLQQQSPQMQLQPQNELISTSPPAGIGNYAYADTSGRSKTTTENPQEYQTKSARRLKIVYPDY